MSGKQPFQPGNIRGHVYLLATGYLAYLIYQNIRHCMEQGYVTPLQLGGTLLLAAGAVRPAGHPDRAGLPRAAGGRGRLRPAGGNRPGGGCGNPGRVTVRRPPAGTAAFTPQRP